VVKVGAFPDLLRPLKLTLEFRFNYITSAALDGGTTMAVLVIFVTVQVHQSSDLSWWGNNLNNQSESIDATLSSRPRASFPNPHSAERELNPFSSAIDGQLATTSLLKAPITGFAPSPAELQLA
jgi:hypothetical protein